MTAQTLARPGAPAVETPAPPVSPASPPSSASKVLEILTAMLRDGRGAVSLTEVALVTGLPKSTTHRLLKVLEDHRFLDRSGSLYCLGDVFWDISESARWSPVAELRDAAYPHLASLFERSGAIAVHLAVLRGPSVQYVDKLMGPDGVRLPTRVGGRFPAACTGLGKAILALGPAEILEDVLTQPLPRATPRSVTGPGHLIAQLRQGRVDGYVVELEEACQGVACVAAPILVEGRPVAAVSVAIPTVALGRWGRHALERGSLVGSTADAIGRALGGARSPAGSHDIASAPESAPHVRRPRGARPSLTSTQELPVEH